MFCWGNFDFKILTPLFWRSIFKHTCCWQYCCVYRIPFRNGWFLFNPIQYWLYNVHPNPSLSGWWFQPLWTILVKWDCCSQNMENITSPKPPTSLFMRVSFYHLSVVLSLQPHSCCLNWKFVPLAGSSWINGDLHGKHTPSKPTLLWKIPKIISGWFFAESDHFPIQHPSIEAFPPTFHYQRIFKAG
jgi:hypothetical protein